MQSKWCNSIHCVKRLRNWSYSGPYFPTFGLNMERYGILRIRTLYAVMYSVLFMYFPMLSFLVYRWWNIFTPTIWSFRLNFCQMYCLWRHNSKWVERWYSTPLGRVHICYILVRIRSLWHNTRIYNLNSVAQFTWLY